MLVPLTNAQHDLATASVLANAYLLQSDLPRELAQKSAATNEQLEATQRLVARPSPYRFVIEPTHEKPAK